VDAVSLSRHAASRAAFDNVEATAGSPLNAWEGLSTLVVQKMLFFWALCAESSFRDTFLGSWAGFRALLSWASKSSLALAFVMV
jgi:hypothetical protein